MVLLKGGVNYYAKGGRLSFNATSIQPYGKGLLYEKFLELKAALESKGYFALERKKAIPKRVRRVGVVTSATGAVIQDIIDVTKRRNNSVDIVLYPVKVQGVGAEHEIAEGIKFFSDYDKVDVIIVARGGGSIEDLAPFNTEIVANAVYECKKPLVSAVGHETDTTIIDYVADLRAPTPSAAAELVVWSKMQEVADIYEVLAKIIRLLQYKYTNLQTAVMGSVNEIFRAVQQKAINATNEVSEHFLNLTNCIDKAIVKSEHVISSYEQVINKINPITLAKNGYIRVMNNDKFIFSTDDVSVDDLLKIELLDGDIIAKTTDIIKGEKL